MSNRIRRGLFAAAGLIAGLAAQPARADGDIEKPPGVPPEVCAAKTACPTLTGPCFGHYPTRWRVLSGCCVAPGPVAGAPVRPTAIPPASRLRAAADRPQARSETVTRAARPTPGRVVDIPAASEPDFVIPTPGSAQKAGAGPGRAAAADVVAETPRLRK